MDNNPKKGGCIMRCYLSYLIPRVVPAGEVKYEVAGRWVDVNNAHELEIKLREVCFQKPLEHNGKIYWRKPIETELSQVL